MILLGVAMSMSGIAKEINELYPLEKVKYGLKFRCQSTLSPAGVQEFKGTVWGVLADLIGPGHNLIVAELSGNFFKQTKVISGQSGSPCFAELNGQKRFLGTISYSINFSAAPVAYLTPAEELLNSDKCLTKKKILKGEKEVFRFIEEKSGMKLDWLSSLSNNIVAVVKEKKEKRDNESIKIGDVLAIQFLWGDVDLSAFGTVSYISGRKIFMLGHPIFQMGAVEFRLARAKVLGVQPSLVSSFIIAAPIKDAKALGVIKEDRESGIVGILGEEPKNFITSKVKLTTSCGVKKEFQYYGVGDKILGPIVNALAVYNIVSSWSPSYGPQTIFVRGSIKTENGLISLAEAFEGENEVSLSFYQRIYEILSQLIKNNDRVKNITLNINIFDTLKSLEIEKATIERIENSSEEEDLFFINSNFSDFIRERDCGNSCCQKNQKKKITLLIAIKLQKLQSEETRVIKVKIELSQNIADGRGEISVLSAKAMNEIESERYREYPVGKRIKDKIKNLITILSSEKPDAIYISIKYPTRRVEYDKKGEKNILLRREIIEIVQEYEVSDPELENSIVKGSAQIPFEIEVNGGIIYSEK